MINIIDQSGKFNQQLKQIPNSTTNIAIFGTQSSGKSTLINAAFDTHFPVLDSKQQRKRCTKGIWLQNNGKFNIIDTQGFDSVQRSKNQRIIQRQIALFCLAICDVVIVNLWMNQIGRYQGGQVHILKSIINAANYLVKSQSKTLLFVIKDCSRDANHDILKEQLQNQVNKIIAQCPAKGPKSLKFNMQYYFMSHYIYYPQQYQKQAKKLPTLIRTKKSNLSSHQPKDRIIYLTHLWQTITSNQGQIDLRQQQQAIRSYIINRIRKQSQQTVQQKLTLQTRIQKLNSYQRMYQYYVKKGFEQIKHKLPKYTQQKLIKQQFCLLQQQLQYIIHKHFTQKILKNQQQYLLKQILQKQLIKKQNTLQLQKTITQQRKKVLNLYKLLVQGHKQSQMLIARFAQKITEQSASFQTQVTHLFNMFQMKLESQVNKQLDLQVRKIKFDGTKISGIFKKLCKQYQYNQWEVNAKQIWQRSIHRTLTQKLPQFIQSCSNSKKTTVLSSLFGSDHQVSIIGQYKNLEKKVEVFIKQLLKYYQQEDSGQQYIEMAKEKLRVSLQYALNEQRKRFRVSMLMLGIFCIFCYGEFMFLLKAGGVKKRMRRYFSYLYIAVVGIIVVGSIVKRVIKGHVIVHPSII